MTDSYGAVRVRIAPGPTGKFHIGRTRTALINWLFARHHGGTFVLRVEDTDQKRSTDENLQTIYDSLRWLGLDWDEGPLVGGPYEPYFQMARLDTYKDAATRLTADENAYPCYCTPDELNALREQARIDKRPFRYPGTCRHLTAEQRAQREAEGRIPALRLRVPADGATSFSDLVLGEIVTRNAELDDFIIVRPDGIPTYNFAVVVDDSTMRITHVIRGQDHVPNTPKQVLIYQYLGEPLPVFAHVPLVVGLDRGKIGARHGAGALTDYGRDGYLPEAIVNYFGTLGISYGEERDVYSVEELIERFDIDRVGRASASYDEEKMLWMNGVYIRNLSLDEFVQRSLPFLELRGLVRNPASADQLDLVRRALALEQERVRSLADTPDAVEFFLRDELIYDPALLVQKKSTRDNALRVLEAAREIVDGSADFEHDALDSAFRALAETLGLKTGVVFGTVRVAITGRTAAPGLFDTMLVLGRERVSTRLDAARKLLQSWEPAVIAP